MLAAAAGIATLLALVGRLARWLTTGGAVAAAAVGTTVLWGSGTIGFLLLGVFFVTGSLLAAGGAPRTALQVLANGWTAASGALLVPVEPALGWAVLVGGLAAAQADTWATEVGRRSGAIPLLITTRAPVAPGTSGGITKPGTVGGMLGAAVLAASAWGLGLPPTLAGWAAGAGVLGMTADSLLGATVQGRFRCAACGADTEVARHCGVAAAPVQGWPWLTNDAVNALGSGVGAALAALAFAW